MPNWVTNKLFIDGGGSHKDDRPGVIQDIQNALKEDKGFIPTLIPAAPYTEEDQIVIGGAHVGYKLGDDRYDWCLNNWGVKWGDCHTEFLYGPPASDYFVWQFDTAWGEPRVGIKNISGMECARGVDIYMLSIEEQPSFRGRYHFKNGETLQVVEEDCFTIDWPKEPDDDEAHIGWQEHNDRLWESLTNVTETIWGPEWSLTIKGAETEAKAGEYAWGR